MDDGKEVQQEGREASSVNESRLDNYDNKTFS